MCPKAELGLILRSLPVAKGVDWDHLQTYGDLVSKRKILAHVGERASINEHNNHNLLCIIRQGTFRVIIYIIYIFFLIKKIRDTLSAILQKR